MQLWVSILSDQYASFTPAGVWLRHTAVTGSMGQSPALCWRHKSSATQQ